MVGAGRLRRQDGRTHFDMVFDDNNESLISREDFAVAILDEIEKPQHIRQRFTVAY